MEDRKSFGYGVLGFVFPLVGLVLWLVWKEVKPLTARSAGKGALVSTVLGVLFYMAVFVSALSTGVY